MAWDTFTRRRHAAAGDANWAVFEARMIDLMPLALQVTEDAVALYGDDIRFGFSLAEFVPYSTDKGMRRFDTISGARGRPVDEIDADYSPLHLEDSFADDEKKILATPAHEGEQSQKPSKPTNLGGLFCWGQLPPAGGLFANSYSTHPHRFQVAELADPLPG